MKLRFAISLLMGASILFAFTGCGDLIAGLRAESREADEEADRDRDETDRVAQNYKPKTLRGLSANNVSEYEPPAARTYGRKLAGRAEGAEEDAQETFHRATRDDFVDKAARENSLWNGQGQSNYLFANNRIRQPGDMLTADVEKELRREIQYQLWMTLPPEQRKVKRAPASTGADSVTNAAGAAAKDAAGAAAGAAAAKAGADKGVEAKAKDAAEEAAKTNMGTTKEDDFIRMEVVENMGNGMMRVLGQKRVIYRGVSRVVEVAALVNTKDIDDANHTKSSTFLDTKAQVIQ